MPFDTAMIKLRSIFAPTEDLDYLLDMLGSITDDNSIQNEDNGLAQSVTVRKGIAQVTRATVRSRVTLRPYRTFLEVEQPESEFLVRLREGGEIGLFEADGGMWRLNARTNIAEHLKRELDDEIQTGKVIVMI